MVLFLVCCKTDKKKKQVLSQQVNKETIAINYAKGFSIEKMNNDVTIIKVTSPWPNANKQFKYALISKNESESITLNKENYDAVIHTPINKYITSSTTHVPALESLAVIDKLVGFPDTKYISSKATRERINSGFIKELGNNATLNTEMVLAINPDIVFGFSISNKNPIYETLQKSNIPVAYNGDWTEETPLGKAEWIKFFAPFFGKEKEADSIFKTIESAYLNAKSLAKKAKTKPTVLSGALYQDVWYLPGGKSWAAQFFSDANAEYLWKETESTGSLSLSIESVLQAGKKADYWLSPAQYTSYKGMLADQQHYSQFNAFQHKKIYTFANTLGETGGMLYYELGPNRPDLVLKDIIHILHPEILPEHELFFFTPLE